MDDRPATLGNLLAYGYDLTAHCLACRRFADLHTLDLAAKLGEGFPVPGLARRLRCSRCGARDITVRVTNPGAPYSEGWRNTR